MLIIKAVGMRHDNDVYYFVCTEAFSGGFFGCLDYAVYVFQCLVVFIVFDEGSYIIQKVPHIVAQQRNIFLIALHALDFLCKLSLLYLHKIILCGNLLLAFNRVIVDHAERQKADAHEKWHKLDHYAAATVKKLRVHCCRIVEYVVEKRHDAYRYEFHVGLCKNIGQCGCDEPVYDKVCEENAGNIGQINNPGLVAERLCDDRHPVTYLTAHVGTCDSKQ